MNPYFINEKSEAENLSKLYEARRGRVKIKDEHCLIQQRSYYVNGATFSRTFN
jgi:hypothetical protein